MSRKISEFFGSLGGVEEPDLLRAGTPGDARSGWSGVKAGRTNTSEG